MQLFSNKLPQTLLTSAFQTITTVVVATLSIVITARFAGPLPISVNQTVAQQEQPFMASGSAQIEAVPDQAEVSLGIFANGSSVEAVQSEANQIISAITQELRNLGIDSSDIQTSNYSISPSYDFSRDRQEISGYQVSANLNVSVTDFEVLSQAIDAATRLGANQVGGIQFSLSQELQDELRIQAREEAIQDAKENARELARLAGLELGRVINVSESRANQPDYPMPYLARAEAVSDSGAPTPVEPGSTEYSYQVTLSYETR